MANTGEHCQYRERLNFPILSQCSPIETQTAKSGRTNQKTPQIQPIGFESYAMPDSKIENNVSVKTLWDSLGENGYKRQANGGFKGMTKGINIDTERTQT